jgi:hypothetical protein
MWDASWSHLPLVAGRQTTDEKGITHDRPLEGAASTVQHAAAGTSERLVIRHAANDVGHLSTVAEVTSRQHDIKAKHVMAHLEVVDSMDAGVGPVVKVTLQVLDTHTAEPGKQASFQVHNRLVQQLEHLAHSRASMAAVSHLSSLAGFLRGQHQARPGAPGGPFTSSARQPYEPLQATAALKTQEEGVHGVAGTGSDSPAYKSSPKESDKEGVSHLCAGSISRLVTLRIVVAETYKEQPCTLILRAEDVTDMSSQSPAAPPAPAGSRLHALSGLFRSSRGGATSSALEAHLAADPSQQHVRESFQAAADIPTPEDSTSMQQQDAQEPGLGSTPVLSERDTSKHGWAFSGAIGSLYGFVSHAAEVAVRPGHQVEYTTTFLS